MGRFDDGVVLGVRFVVVVVVVGLPFKNWRGNFLWEFCEKLRKSWVPLHSDALIRGNAEGGIAYPCRYWSHEVA